MKLIPTLLLSLLFVPTISPFAVSAQNSSLPSHCKANEYTYLNAKMASASTRKKTGRILSICADKAQEPFGKLIYRYGAIGKVELEQVATPGRPFYIFNRDLTPRVGYNVLFFTNYGYTYYVKEAYAMGSGITLSVYHKGKRIVDLVSGQERGVDFEAGLIDLNFLEASSLILRRKAPIDEF